jgi:hypothetical protein
MLVRNTACGGPSLHPAGVYCGKILSIECMTGEERPASPFGGWVRFRFQTKDGIVAGLYSMEYGPDTDLGNIVKQINGHLPDEYDLNNLLDAAVIIDVIHERQHGALQARAALKGD